MVITGGTTLYEGWEHTRGGTAWEGVNQKGSYNHYFKGACCRWDVEYLGGICLPDPDNIAFNQVKIRPRFIKALDYVQVRYKGVRGEISSSWKRENGRIFLTVKIPEGCQARIMVPVEGVEKEMELGAGEHTVTCVNS
jgi:alpha-L-rhamnosidase